MMIPVKIFTITKLMQKIISICLFMTIALSCGCIEENISKLDGKRISITGEIRLVGNAPFSYLTIRGPENTTILLKNLSKEQQTFYKNKIGKIETIEGMFEIISKQTADKKHRIKDYVLIVDN